MTTWLIHPLPWDLRAPTHCALIMKQLRQAAGKIAALKQRRRFIQSPLEVRLPKPNPKENIS